MKNALQRFFSLSNPEGDARRQKIVALKMLCFALCLVCLVELASNFETIESFFFPKVEPTSIEATTLSDDSYLLSTEDTITISFDKVNLKNIGIHTDALQTPPSNEDKRPHIDIFLSDEANSQLYLVSTQTPESADSVIRLQPMGKVSKLLIQLNITDVRDNGAYPLNNPEDAALHEYNNTEALKNLSEELYSLSLDYNTFKPFVFMPARMIGVFAFALLLMLLRPSSRLYRRSFTDKSFQRRWTLLLTAVIVACAIAGYNPSKAADDNEHQYYDLAIALAQGNTYLDEEPSEELLAMDNPYDTNERILKDVDFLWDRAYYEGHYYVYFGILPCLVFYLPLYMITGLEMPALIAVILCLIACLLGVRSLLYTICKRWFPKTNQGLFVIMLLTMVFGSSLTVACTDPGHYTLPIVMGLALGIWGLRYWISATAQEKIHLRDALLGSCFMAAIIACRPQLFIMAVFGIVLLAPYLKRDKLKCIPTFLLALIPFIVVFALVGIYNHMRFGSYFDFGANYNLTTNDMNLRGFNLGRIPLSIFSYLFQLPAIQVAGSLLRSVVLASTYNGIIISENMYGGIFALCSILLLPLLSIFKTTRQKLHDHKLFALVAVALFSGFILTIFDGNGAGILLRYFLDFSFFFAFATCLCLGSWFNEENMGNKPSLHMGSWSIVYKTTTTVYELILGKRKLSFLPQKKVVNIQTNTAENTAAPLHEILDTEPEAATLCNEYTEMRWFYTYAGIVLITLLMLSIAFQFIVFAQC